MKYLHAGLMAMLEGANGLNSADLLVLRLNTALLDYGQLLRAVKRPKACPALGASVHDTLRDYLRFAFAVHLNVSLPDTLDKIWIGDMRCYCLAAWHEHVKEEYNSTAPCLQPTPGVQWACNKDQCRQGISWSLGWENFSYCAWRASNDMLV